MELLRLPFDPPVRLTVPAAAAEVLDLVAPGGAAWQDAIVSLGARAEVDLDDVAALRGSAAARALADYWVSSRHLAERLRRGEAGGTAVLVVRRSLGVWRQGTGREKSDLVEQYEAMGRLGPSVAGRLEELLGAGGEGEVTEDLVVLDRQLPAGLGGPATPLEQRRVLRLTVRYAGWRDRRLRRLAQVEALCDEVWPDPGPLAQLWAATPGA